MCATFRPFRLHPPDVSDAGFSVVPISARRQWPLFIPSFSGRRGFGFRSSSAGSPSTSWPYRVRHPTDWSFTSVAPHTLSPGCSPFGYRLVNLAWRGLSPFWSHPLTGARARAKAQSSPPCSFNSLITPKSQRRFHHLNNPETCLDNGEHLTPHASGHSPWPGVLGQRIAFSCAAGLSFATRGTPWASWA